MEIIDKDNREKIWLEETATKATNKDLFETIEKWKWDELRLLLEWYFSMMEHLEEINYLVKNVNHYNEILSKLIDFSHTPFMEEKVWRVSDNGNKEYCWAYLRNLLTPLKNMIAIVNNFSNGKIKEDTFRLFVNKSGLNFEENKKLFLEFCDFLGKENK